MNEEEAFDKLFCSLALREYKVGNYELYASDMRDVWYVRPGVRANCELAEYLLKACIRMNELYPGMFDIRVKSLEGVEDSELIGSHRISDMITDKEQFRSLIRRGEFAPPIQDRLRLNLVEASILRSELNRYFASGCADISRGNLCAIGPDDLERVVTKLHDWQSKGCMQVQSNPSEAAPDDICVQLLRPILEDD